MGAEQERIAVIGAGAWGTTLANLLAEKGHPVTLWVYEPELAATIARERCNPLYLPDVPVHAGVTPTPQLAEVVRETAIFVSVVPSLAVRAVWRQLGPLLPARALVVSATKGIEAETLLTMSQVLHQLIPAAKEVALAVLSGPSFAREVSQKVPTAVVAAAAEAAVAARVQRLFSTPAFRVYTSSDVLGVELGGALKNVIAIAAGVCDGLHFGLNARAALITRGLAEMTALGVAMGARPQTFAGLSGLGDLVLTCTGTLSRNHTVGVQLAQGKPLATILQDLHAVAEGVHTTASALALARRYGVEMPITEQVAALLRGEVTPQQAVMALMTRPLKAEEG